MACYPACPRSWIQSPGHKRRESWVKRCVDLWVHKPAESDEPHSTRDALTSASATERHWAVWSIALWWNWKTWRVCWLTDKGGGLSLYAIEISSHRLCSCSRSEWCPSPWRCPLLLHFLYFPIISFFLTTFSFTPPLLIRGVGGEPTEL